MFPIIFTNIQVQSWLEVNYDPLKWGWTTRGGQWYPETTDLPQIPVYQ